MTTARERYEVKTKVVTFRVSSEVYKELEEIKAKGGLSYADLIKLGAGFARDEIKAKLAQISGLENKLAELSSAVEREQQRLNESLDEERRHRVEELDLEIEAFKLFDRRWTIEQVGFKLGLRHETAYRYFLEWGEMRKDKRALERELLRACLKRHIYRLQEQRTWAHVLPSTPKEQLEKLERQIDDCQRLLATPSRITKPDREFLLAEYSATVLSVTAKKTTGNTSRKAPQGGTKRP